MKTYSLPPRGSTHRAVRINGSGDVAVTVADYDGVAGEAMAIGERTPVAVLDAPASGRLAVGEALTNLLAADVAWFAVLRGSDHRASDALIRAASRSHPPDPGIVMLVADDRSVAILGEVASSRSLEAAPICQQNNTPMISPSSAATRSASPSTRCPA